MCEPWSEVQACSCLLRQCSVTNEARDRLPILPWHASVMDLMKDDNALSALQPLRWYELLGTSDQGWHCLPMLKADGVPEDNLLANCVTAQDREEAKLHKVFLGRGDWGMTQRSEALPRTIVGSGAYWSAIRWVLEKTRWDGEVVQHLQGFSPEKGLAHLCKQAQVIDLGFGEDFGDTGKKLNSALTAIVTPRNTSCDFEPKCCQQHTEVWERGWDMVERLWLQDTGAAQTGRLSCKCILSVAVPCTTPTTISSVLHSHKKPGFLKEENQIIWGLGF